MYSRDFTCYILLKACRGSRGVKKKLKKIYSVQGKSNEKSNKLVNTGLTFDGYVSLEAASKHSKRTLQRMKRNENHEGKILKMLLTGSMIE